jgi:hypothetical protein
VLDRPDGAQAYRGAPASKEGPFVLGSSISKKEDFFLRKLQSALKM